jgi:hypothetical protein
MSEMANNQEFVDIVAREISSGIDRALGFWLGRIELELVDASFTMAQRLAAIEAIVQEYKASSAREEVVSA